ncbi:MAG: chromosome segregation protein SMC [Gammaproteobacteria bacterium]|nr:chromosome segregation protein SMC [Gammaproteobacteria bacterium]
MRLEKIKLAGFKSFVDPTTIIFSRDLTGVVGPNGCGKSNIIDAVRWVLGESSARQLRGEQITDVIFNGSTRRKPVGQASIELTFDNSDGALGGEFANYSEIVIRRQVDREGQSVYSLNGTRCRRRDIMDVFFGTGLGPRSYAIIEQGMISNIIESKPEELRVYLEEVAGISKYKERRRETENRIASTQENLLRINDLRGELEKQLKHLNQQASAAKRYKFLREEERHFKAQLLALDWRNLTTDIRQSEQKLSQLEHILTAQQTELQHTETGLEKQRDAQNQVNDTLNSIHQNYYQIGTDIAKLEQSIQFHQERSQQAREDLEQIALDEQHIQETLKNNQAVFNKTIEAMNILEPQLVESGQALVKSQELLKQAENNMHQWRAQWEAFLNVSSKNSEEAKIRQTRIGHLEQQRDQIHQRLSEIEMELNQTQEELKTLDSDLLKANLAKAHAQYEELNNELNQMVAALQTHEIQSHQLQVELEGFRQTLHEKRERQIALQTLKQATSEKQSEKTISWLKQHHLNQQERLAQILKVEAGWERSIELVLETYLDAFCVANLDDLEKILVEFEEGNLTFVSINPAKNSSPISDKPYPLLKDKVQSKVSHLLEGIYIADDFEQALENRHLLSEQESFITQDGIWLGPQWLKIYRGHKNQPGIIGQEKELKAVEQQIETLSHQIRQTEQQSQETRKKIQHAKMNQTQLQNQVSFAKDQYTKWDTQHQIQQQRLLQLNKLQLKLQEEYEQKETQFQHIELELKDLRRSAQTQEDVTNSDMQKRQTLLAQKNQLEQILEEIKKQFQDSQEDHHQSEMKLATAKSEIIHLEDNITKTHIQINSIGERKTQLENILAQNDLPIADLKQSLASYLDKRLDVEKQLDETKQRLNQLDYHIKELNTQRNAQQQKIDGTRKALESERLNSQTLKTRQTSIEENIHQYAQEVTQILETITEEMSIEVLNEALLNIDTKIKRLGPINLAAISEYEQLAERKTYLDTQCQDLEEALETLKNAIRKIDRQTRVRFKETFDKVNEIFQELFPQVFGGGKAYLELTSDDLLETGVRILAKPPGKHINNIQLMSGGEKALVGITLIFSLFQFNPSPFCMLDEVDAPLDDTNVLRFCELVKEMAKQVQFIFISHNKIAIEIAQHLMGVTMHEPGVSRVVAVDIGEAVKMAEQEKHNS